MPLIRLLQSYAYYNRKLNNINELQSNVLYKQQYITNDLTLCRLYTTIYTIVKKINYYLGGGNGNK